MSTQDAEFLRATAALLRQPEQVAKQTPDWKAATARELEEIADRIEKK